MDKSVLFVSENVNFFERCKIIAQSISTISKFANNGRSGLTAYAKEEPITVVLYLQKEQTELFVNFFRSQYGDACPLIIITDIDKQKISIKEGAFYLNSDFKNYELESLLGYIVKNCSEEKFTIEKLREFDKKRADIVHSLNQPLTSVVGYVDIILMQDLDDVPKEILDMIKKVEEGSKLLVNYMEKLRNHRLFPKE